MVGYQNHLGGLVKIIHDVDGADCPLEGDFPFNLL